MSEENPASDVDIPQDETQAGWKHLLRDIVETLGLAILLFLAINAISARVRVEGFSMRPTLDDGQYILVNRLAYQFSDFERGDIVIFRPPNTPEPAFWRQFAGLPGLEEYEDYIKRVIGLPGETVLINDGRVYIDGVALAEDYIAAPPTYFDETTVPEGYIYVLGDNRNNSSDSHSWGALPAEHVIGRAILIYWPFNDWMVIHHSNALAAP
ncbi:MAG: signal peptidase I [Anaerolineales bacterium]|nr:signal peptidase I [Anaerolineales bacterium]